MIDTFTGHMWAQKGRISLSQGSHQQGLHAYQPNWQMWQLKYLSFQKLMSCPESKWVIPDKMTFIFINETFVDPSEIILYF